LHPHRWAPSIAFLRTAYLILYWGTTLIVFYSLRMKEPYEGVAFFLQFRLYEESLTLMEDLSSS